jgi:3-oxoacyl-[acyl-carrier protein] reductase
MTTRRFLVTGASKGIGLALSRRLSDLGHRVVGLARNPACDFPGDLVQVDLADRVATAAALEGIVSRGAIDGVVNNVGLVRPQPLGKIDLDDLSAVLDLNMRTAVQAAQAALPAMQAAAWGRIVNVASLVVLGAPDRTAYSAAKAGLMSFTRTWALELAAAGITVNAVSPGPTETELFRANNQPGSPGEARFLAGIPMRRFAQPGEIAAAIAFLLSEDAAFMTGQTLFVDGGSSIGKALA